MFILQLILSLTVALGTYLYFTAFVVAVNNQGIYIIILNLTFISHISAGQRPPWPRIWVRPWTYIFSNSKYTSQITHGAVRQFSYLELGLTRYRPSRSQPNPQVAWKRVHIMTFITFLTFYIVISETLALRKKVLYFIKKIDDDIRKNNNLHRFSGLNFLVRIAIACISA